MIMQLLNKIVLVGLLAVSLQGCQLGSDDEETVIEATDITRSVSDTVETINRTDLYRFIVTGDSNFFELEDDIDEIVVTGDNNVITIIEDSALAALTISGSDNTIKLETGLSTRIDNILIGGEGNTVIITEYLTALDNGTGTSLTGTKVTL